uniref:PH domain-containing protein n=1 Tax=Scophthalmus maximus TaxID=52904 RepID=A0A8D3DSJ4_SCOMX
MHSYLQKCDLDMNGKVNAVKITHSKSANMVSDLSPEGQPYTRTSRAPRKAATFGKRSNSMRRNPKAEVTKQGWLYKQASSGVKQWNKRWFVLADRSLFYYKDEKEDSVLGSLPLLSFRIRGVEPSDSITRKFAFKAEHAGTRTYYFSTDSHEEQKEWITAMSEAAAVNVQPQQRCSDKLETQSLSGPLSDQQAKEINKRRGEGEDEGGGHGPNHTLYLNHHPNGGGTYGPRYIMPHKSNNKQHSSRSHSGHGATQGHPEGGDVLRRGFVPRTVPERVAQRKSSMAQLQQWVNQRRGMASQEDINSPSRYYPVNRGVSADYCGYPGDPHYVDEYPFYPPGVRPDSICSVSGVGGYDWRWTVQQKRHSLRDGPHQLYGPPMPRDPWGPQYYGGMETSMRRLSIQPRSRSVPRSPSSSSGGPYSPVPPNFASPARSLSARFDRFPGRMRDDVIYADPSIYSLRRSLSSPKYDYSGDRRSLSQGLYQQSYPVSPSIHNKMVCATYVLHMSSVTQCGVMCSFALLLLEEALVATHQEMELYHNQPLAMEKLQFKKETLQNQLINIRGELSQASSALTTTRLQFEALEDEANAIHGDLWEQLNAGGQTELVHRHIQKEFWRVQDVLEGLHKNNSSRGTDTAKHRVASGASGSFSTNSPASPLSSISLTSPLSPFSPVPGSKASPTKQLGPEESVPPRPPLPKAYYPLELSPTSPPSIPPLPFDSTAWLRSLGLDDGYLDGEESHIKKVFGCPSLPSPSPNGQMKSKMSIEEQNQRIRRNQSSSVREKRRSLNLSGGQSPANYKVVRRRLTAHEIDIKDLEAAVRGQGQESPREEIARLRQLKAEPEHYDLDFSKELMAPDKVLIPERYLDEEDDAPLSPEEQKEKQKKLERIKTLIAKSNLQNVVPLLDGPVEGGAPVSSQQQLHEQEKRIEISCALAAEASRRSRIFSGEASFRRCHRHITLSLTLSHPQHVGAQYASGHGSRVIASLYCPIRAWLQV